MNNGVMMGGMRPGMMVPQQTQQQQQQQQQQNGMQRNTIHPVQRYVLTRLKEQQLPLGWQQTFNPSLRATYIFQM